MKRFVIIIRGPVEGISGANSLASSEELEQIRTWLKSLKEQYQDMLYQKFTGPQSYFSKSGKIENKINWAVIGFIVFFFAIGFFLRPYFGISKIKGTPSWTMFSAAICTALFYLLYWLMEVKKQTKWSEFFMPAAANPLLIYILPGVIYYFCKAFNIHIIPGYFRVGVPGILWSLLFSIIMLFVMKILNHKIYSPKQNRYIMVNIFLTTQFKLHIFLLSEKVHIFKP